jgi:hypothetical protein
MSSYREMVDELRCRPNAWLREERSRVRREQRKLRLREVAITTVLGERGATDGQDAVEFVQTHDQVRSSTARAEVEIGRRLEALPEIAARAEAGEVSFDQLEHLVELATPETDAEWARRGAHTAPSELGRLVRQRRVVSTEEAEERRRARSFRWWRGRDTGMLNVRGEIPDVDGALVEAVFEHAINAMKPASGEPWESRARRGSDALVALCRGYQAGHQPNPRWKPTIVVHTGATLEPEVNGIPIARSTVGQLIADGARVREVHDEDPLANLTGDSIPAELRDYLKGRDPVCRVPGCERTFGLDAHHTIPRSHGGPTDKHHVVMVCKPDHRKLTPHGPWHLIGDPEQIDGLRLVHQDDLDDARAGPSP